MAQKQKLGKYSSHTNGNLGHFWPNAITRQPMELEVCSRPLWMGKSSSLE